MLGIVHHDVAIPILWLGLDNGKGNSPTQIRIDLIEKFKKIFPNVKILSVLADAEFIGKTQFNYLNDNNIPFCIPIRANAQVKQRGKDETMNVSRCFDSIKKAHEIKYFRNRKVIYGNRVYLSAVRLSDNSLLILASNAFQVIDLINKYKKRWQIEMLFSCLKTRGFDFEATHLTDPVKVEKMLAILALTFIWAHLVGQWQHQQKPIKLKSHKRLEKSVFRVGIEL